MSNVVPFERPTPAVAEGAVPPHDLDAEAAVLSAVILDDERLATVADFLRPDHFYSESHRRMFEAVLALRAEGKPIDVITVASWLKDRGRLAQVGGMAYVTEAVQGAAVVANLAAYGEQVHTKWRLRAAAQLASRIAAESYGDVGDAQAWLDRGANALAELSRDTLGGKAESNMATLRRVIKDLVERSQLGKRVHGFPMGIPSLDDLLGGVLPGQKMLVTAKPGYGKTAMGMHVARSCAKAGIGVAVFSLEMTREEVLMRLVCAESGVDGTRIKDGRLSQGEWERVTAAAGVIGKQLPIAIYDSQTLHVGQIAAIARRAKETMPTTHGAELGLVVIDYLQKMQGAPEASRTNRYEQLVHATRTLKLLARQLQVGVIELAQQKKPPENPRPGSGSTVYCPDAENEADVVMHLWNQNLEDRSAVTVVVEKQRNGDVGDVDVVFERHVQNWRDANQYGETGYQHGPTGEFR